jgi:hypothetical protein
MTEKKLSFLETKTEKQLNEIYNFNMQVFADSHDFAWTKDNIKNEIDNGWNLYSVRIDDDIVCCLFVKNDNKTLLTKNTPIKLNYQGQGFSHLIKEFYEEYANEQKLEMKRFRFKQAGKWFRSRWYCIFNP